MYISTSQSDRYNYFALGHHWKNSHGLLEIGPGFHLCETLIKNSNTHMSQQNNVQQNNVQQNKLTQTVSDKNKVSE